MTLELALHSQFPDQIVRETVQAALRNQAELARFRYEQFAKECQIFERKFNLTTEAFTTKFDAGELGDAEEFFDWFAAARGRVVWKQKASILGEVAA
ncbi:MAG: hypothetical protein HZC40_09705 [Chloroflexi bacterium]|nr:hypothetical protein [Chloroflexota bacterium]